MIEKKISKELAPFIGTTTPGLCVQAFHHGKKKVDIQMGDVYPYYDWSSLTKVVFTTTLFMNLYEKAPRILEDKVLKYLDWFFQPTLAVRELLTHTSGLVWWKPFYQSIPIQLPREERWLALKEIMAQEKLEPVQKAVYSDLNFLLLGYLLEKKYEKNLLELWEVVRESFELEKTHFHVDNQPVYDVEKYAPTETCPWRQIRLQGKVHDENTFALGGVASHAGLFGSINDLSKWILKLREVYFSDESAKFFIQPQTVKTFFQRAISNEVGDFALGFMVKSAQDSTAGNLFSRSSIGHTGFTGTSTWFDLENDLIVNVVSNRVYYGREKSDEMKKLRVLIHDTCFREIVG